MDENIIDPTNSIETFYVRQSIFLTGATGFLGKVYIEKILRSCPDVREVFVLMRSKKGLSINERLEKILNLPALVYVSTAFAHVNNVFIEEKVCPPIADWRKVIKMVETLDEHIINIFTTKCLNNFPNTYIYSKNLAEAIIAEYSSSLPCAIIRPSIGCETVRCTPGIFERVRESMRRRVTACTQENVTPSLNDPFPGWIDNFYGMIGILVGGGKGVIRVFNAPKHICLDLISVDIVIKIIIITTWKLGLNTFTTDQPFILNCAAFNKKKLSLQGIIKMGVQLAEELPFEGVLWTPSTILTDSSITYYILTILLHILPAILIDLILKFTKYQPMLIRLQRKIYVANCALKHFVHHEWKFDHKNGLKLLSSIPPKDKEMFSFDISNIDIKDYYRNGMIGAKLYLLREDMNRLDAAKTHCKRVDLFVTTLKIITIIGLPWMIYKWICT
ncbi:Fatty acyl-CoA reductase [Camponotus japonicus]